jgi:hypothetical protein
MFGFGKRTERIITIDDEGNVADVTNGKQLPSPAKSAFSFFSFFGSTPYNDNGREYDPVSDSWKYTASANGNANPYQCNYEAPQDYQGSVPSWDGS